MFGSQKGVFFKKKKKKRVEAEFDDVFKLNLMMF